MNTPTKGGSTFENAKPTPRINKSLMRDYTEWIVRLVCRVISSNQNSRQVQTTDGATVNVQLSVDSINYQPNSLIEIVGRVKDETTIEELTSAVLPENVPFDFNNYNTLLQLQHRHKELFGLP